MKSFREKVLLRFSLRQLQRFSKVTGRRQRVIELRLKFAQYRVKQIVRIQFFPVSNGCDRIHARFFKHLLDQLTMYKTADGRPLLDDCTAVWLNSNGNGPPHDVSNVPHIIAGTAGGFLRTGQYLNLAGVKNNKLLSTIATAAGVRNASGAPVDDFGDPGLARGLISEIVA